MGVTPRPLHIFCVRLIMFGGWPQSRGQTHGCLHTGWTKHACQIHPHVDSTNRLLTGLVGGSTGTIRPLSCPWRPSSSDSTAAPSWCPARRPPEPRSARISPRPLLSVSRVWQCINMHVCIRDVCACELGCAYVSQMCARVSLVARMYSTQISHET